MFSLHVKLTLVTLMPAPFIAAGAWVFGRWVFPRELKAREAAGGLASVLTDNVAGIRQIKSYTLEADKQRDFDASSERYKAMQTKLQRAWSVYAPGMGFVGDTGVILLMGFGSWWCITGDLTIGQMGQFLLLIGMLYEPIGRLNALGTTFVSSAAAARRVFDILQLEGTERLHSGVKLESVRGEIRFENVSFRYDDTRPTLHGINLSVHPGQTVAIVGATGAGKSTLFQLLTRFYDPDEGEILLDGRPIREVSKVSLRDAIGYVTQESYLFNQTVRENLKLGKPDATDEELWLALEHACAREFVEQMENRLDATVGERGTRLSGGEKQRIAIARAFLKDAPILLLDEATSAVDTKSEKLIQQAIDRLRVNRTCLVIAHRLSTVKHADCIYVMKQGRVLAHGTHEELMRSCGYYAELAKLSFTEEKLAE
jgi:ATP-binding cassette subfamily B protein/subfamily B ATP-binding cassette protein MsbA